MRLAVSGGELFSEADGSEGLVAIVVWKLEQNFKALGILSSVSEQKILSLKDKDILGPFLSHCAASTCLGDSIKEVNKMFS